MNKDLIQEVENKIQTVFTISIFFPTLIYTVSKLVGKTEIEASQFIINWSYIIVPNLISYVFFQIGKNHIKEKLLKWLNNLFLLCIGLFIFPTLLLVSSTSTTISSWITLKFSIISMYGLPIISTIASLLVIGGYIYGSIRRDK